MSNDADKITDPNLLRCAYKKTTSVLRSHFLYAAYVIDALALLVIAYLGITGILIPNVVPVIIAGIAILVSIAWYWYVIAAIPFVYISYGLLWCIARELKEEDWQSDEAKNSAFALAAFAALTALTALALALTLTALALTLAALALALTLAALALALTLTLAALADHKSILFIGAYLHYRKRMKWLKV